MSMLPRLHIVSLPHTQTTHEFDHCAFTAKTRKFATMMDRRGHEVYLYGSEAHDGSCQELVECISRAEQDELLGGYDWYQRGEIYGVDWNPDLPYWRLFNARVEGEIACRIEPRDVICLTTGEPCRRIAEAFSNHLVVEHGVGYEGVLESTHRVFESYSWQAAVYGSKYGASKADGRFFDAVIPNFYDTAEFPAGKGDGGYCVFMSRMTARKGYEIAVEATRRAGVPLKIAGIGGDVVDAPHVEHVGLVDAAARAELLGGAIATLIPTVYVEPFGGVAAESLLVGTPAITTDWGAFPEYVEQGVDGFRCRSMGEFADAIGAVARLWREPIRKRAQARFSMGTVGAQYDAYFERLQTLYGDGFYA